MRTFLMTLMGSVILVGCQSESEKPRAKEKTDEVAMRDNERPNMFDQRQDALQEARTQGRVCNGSECDDQYYQPY